MATRHWELPIILHYDYQPEEPATRNDPGCAACVEIYGIAIPGNPRNEEMDSCIANIVPSSVLQGLEEMLVEYEQQKAERQLERKMIARELQAEALRELNQQRGAKL